jgi:peptide-methionine (R)-S-oxide reductase
MTVLIKFLLFLFIHGPALVYSFIYTSSCISNGGFISNDPLPLQSHSHALHTTNPNPHSKVKACSLQMATNPSNEEYSRRRYIQRVIIFGGVASTTSAITIPLVSHAAGSEPTNELMPNLFKKGKNRTDGYSVQNPASEWTTLLSGTQYNVLRKGGTERQRGSILDKEKRPGTYVCAGCNSPLFASISKFDSGTGWPSFESAIATDAIETEELDFIHSLDGAEVRCRTCGGHLGDVFGDGRRYGSKTGKRYCINGAALIFTSVGGARDLRGDIPPPNKVIEYEPVSRR